MRRKARNSTSCAFFATKCATQMTYRPSTCRARGESGVPVTAFHTATTLAAGLKRFTSSARACEHATTRSAEESIHVKRVRVHPEDFTASAMSAPWTERITLGQSRSHLRSTRGRSSRPTKCGFTATAPRLARRSRRRFAPIRARNPSTLRRPEVSPGSFSYLTRWWYIPYGDHESLFVALAHRIGETEDDGIHPATRREYPRHQ